MATKEQKASAAAQTAAAKERVKQNMAATDWMEADKEKSGNTYKQQRSNSGRGNYKASALAKNYAMKQKFWGQNTGYSWEEKSFTFGNLRSENRRAQERAQDDWLRLKGGQATDIVRDMWKKTMTGEFSAQDFKESIMDQKTGFTGSSVHVGNIDNTFGVFGAGGYNQGMYKEMQATEKERKRTVAKNTIKPGAYEQTRSTVLEGINKNAAKKTLMGQF